MITLILFSGFKQFLVDISLGSWSCAYWPIMWLTHFWHSWSQFFIFAWDITAGGILRTGVLICLVLIDCDYVTPSLISSCNLIPSPVESTKWTNHDRSLLTHWDRDKMDAISQTTFSNAFSWMKIYKFRLRFHWSLFPGVQLKIFQHWFR